MNRDWSYSATNQGILRIAGHHQKIGRGKEGFFSRILGGSPANTLISDFSLLYCQSINFYCFISKDSWNFVKTTLGNKYPSPEVPYHFLSHDSHPQSQVFSNFCPWFLLAIKFALKSHKEGHPWPSPHFPT